MTTLRAVLRKCVEWDHLTTIPKVPMFEVRTTEKRWLTPEEYGELRKHLPKHLKLAADLAVYTGMRISSMLNLTWDRINLDEAHAWVPGQGQQMKSGKPFGIQFNEGAITTSR
jgi:integrase